MPLLKDDKKKLAKKYASQVADAKNVVILKQSGIPVNAINSVRMDIAAAEGNLQIVKKRVFLKGVSDNYEGLSLSEMDGQIAVLYSKNEDDQYAPLKVIGKHLKAWKKEKEEYSFDYVGGRYDNVWQDAEYVKELANLPSKEELVGKLLFLLNYPVSSFARGLQAIADKDPAEDVKDESDGKTDNIVAEENSDVDSKSDAGAEAEIEESSNEGGNNETGEEAVSEEAQE